MSGSHWDNSVVFWGHPEEQIYLQMEINRKTSQAFENLVHELSNDPEMSENHENSVPVQISLEDFQLMGEALKKATVKNHPELNVSGHDILSDGIDLHALMHADTPKNVESLSNAQTPLSMSRRNSIKK